MLSSPEHVAAAECFCLTDAIAASIYWPSKIYIQVHSSGITGVMFSSFTVTLHDWFKLLWTHDDPELSSFFAKSHSTYLDTHYNQNYHRSCDWSHSVWLNSDYFGHMQIESQNLLQSVCVTECIPHSLSVIEHMQSSLCKVIRLIIVPVAEVTLDDWTLLIEIIIVLIVGVTPCD